MVQSLVLVVTAVTSSALAAIGLGADGVSAAADLTLWYRQPARGWSSEALPLGNGRIGCMVFGGVDRERIQFNDNSLWTGDENPSGDYKTMGAYQNFGELLLALDGPERRAAPDGYRRDLDLATAVAHVEFTRRRAHRREMLASHPDEVIAIRWTADKPGRSPARWNSAAPTRRRTRPRALRFPFGGTLENNLHYEARRAGHRPRRQGAGRGRPVAPDGLRRGDHSAGGRHRLLAWTASRGFRGEQPGPAAAAADRSRRRPDRSTSCEPGTSPTISAISIAWRLTLGATRAATGLACRPTQRLAAYAERRRRPGLGALLFQYGRYLLISCSRPGGLAGQSCRGCGTTATTRRGTAITMRTSTSR